MMADVRVRGPVLVRLAALPFEEHRQRWPDVDDVQACRAWLRDVADRAWFTLVREDSPNLADAAVRAGKDVVMPAKAVRSATLSVARACLRVSTRATPFGLAAGVAVARIGPASARVGSAHEVTARPDTVWVDDMRRELLSRPDVLRTLRFAVTDLGERHGDVLVTPAPNGGRVRTAVGRPLAALLDVLDATAGSVSFAEILRRLRPLAGAGGENGYGDDSGAEAKVRALIGTAGELGIVIDNLSAPMTEPDPLGYLLETLRPRLAELEPGTAALLADLAQIHATVTAHHHVLDTADTADTDGGVGVGARKAALRRDAEAEMVTLHPARRSTLHVQTRTDADVTVPAAVLDEVQGAAGALIALTRHQGSDPVWADFHNAFWERYGAGCLVPVTDVVHLAAGIGYPAGYPGSTRPAQRSTVLPRDEILARWVWEALDGGTGGIGEAEVVISDADLAELARLRADTGRAAAGTVTAPHVEVGFRVSATAAAELDAGRFTATIRPAWSAGVLSGRFVGLLAGSGLGALPGALPTLVEGAIPAQLSVTPTFPHAQNVARIPQVLPHVITVGEHRLPSVREELIRPDDLAVYSTGTRLHLVSISRRRVVEPLVLHPLALDKQVPPLARLLAMLSRGGATAWTELDWGPLLAHMPYRPRVRYGRTVLSPARWTLRRADLPAGPCTPDWRAALLRWAERWRCPQVVELRDGDRGLRLTLTEPLHARLLYGHLRNEPVAELAEAPDAEGMGWIGYAHEFTAALVTEQPPLPHPRLDDAPVLTRDLFPVPGEVRRWVQVKLFTHPEDMDEILTRHLDVLLRRLAALPVREVWFVRYRSPGEDDHIRLRVCTLAWGPPAHPDVGSGVGITARGAAPDPDPDVGSGADVRARGAPVDVSARVRTLLTGWMVGLREDKLISRAVVDAYRPETGRYGEALGAAEGVFVADSAAVRHAVADLGGHDRRVVCALGMVEIARGLLGDHDGPAALLAAPVAGPGVDEVTRATTASLRVAPRAAGTASTPGAARSPAVVDLTATPELRRAFRARRAALACYSDALAPDRRAAVLESLLHMHHNRLLGPDRDSEQVCRHAARQASRSLLTLAANR